MNEKNELIKILAKVRFKEDSSFEKALFTSFFQLEVTGLGDFRKNEVIRDLMLLLMQRIGTRLDIKKISKELKISRSTLNDYIAFWKGLIL